MKELKRKKIIDIDYNKANKHDRNKSYTFVSLNYKFFLGKDNIIGRKTIENEIYRNRLHKFYSKNSIINKTNNAVLIQVNETLRKTKLIQRKGYESLDKILNSYTKKSERKQAIRRAVIRKGVKSKWKIYWQNYYSFMTQNSLNKNPYLIDIFINLHQQAFGNRISHVYSNMPKEFRSLITIDGFKVCEFDIKSSQPFFLYLLMKWLPNSNNPAIPQSDITSSYLDYMEM